MLKQFRVKNYKNFKDEICLDFGNTAGYQFSSDCIYEGLISKMLIYGRNATGKTNLGKALTDICVTMFNTPRFVNNGVFLNADSHEDAAVFSYEFIFDGQTLLYQYARFSDMELQWEKLAVNGETIFYCDFDLKQFNFEHLKSIEAETANIARYTQSLEEGEEAGNLDEPRLPFLRWLISNVALKNDSILIKLSNYVRRMIAISSGNSMRFRPYRMYDGFFAALEQRENLKDLEDFFNSMGIECKLVLKKLPDGQRELYFAHEKLVPFLEGASSGTLALFDLYRRLIPSAWDPSFLYFDEFDAFYHYEMAENVIKFFKRKYPKCQIIMTSHNTNLMTNRLMRPDCLFILSRSGTITALCNATDRELREGHNLEKMYISGEFEQYE